MDKRKYPASLFIIGFITNVLFRYFLLSVPALILMIIGIFNKYCLLVGFAILAIDLIISLIIQLKMRNTFLKESDNLDFQEFQDAITKGNRIENTNNLINEKINKNLNEEG